MYLLITQVFNNAHSFYTTLAAVGIGLSVIGGTADARPTRLVDFYTDDATRVMVMPTGSNSVHVNIDNQYTSTGFIAHRNCTTGQVRWRANTGYTRDQILGITATACDL